MSIKALLKEKTVFFLGAGASKPYGLPLGTELKTHINSILPKVSVNLLKHGYDEDFINDFKKALKFTTHPTIDIFLENKTKYREIGAICIADTILSKENEDLLFPQKNWYGSIYDAFELGSGTIKLDNLTILTLNYDRSFEHFFYNNIDFNCRDKLELTAKEEIKKIDVIHVHGMIGEYPGIPYGAKLTNFDTLINISKNIKMVSDKIENSPTFIKARKELLDAKNIVFLGFGYDIQTLQKLIKEIEIGEKLILGTAMEIGEQHKDNIKNIFKNKIKLGQKHHDCDAFLRNNNLVK